MNDDNLDGFMATTRAVSDFNASLLLDLLDLAQEIDELHSLIKFAIGLAAAQLLTNALLIAILMLGALR